MQTIKDTINAYTRSNPRVMQRQEGHVPTGKVCTESFYKLKGNRLVIEQKPVRETVWRNTAMAQALSMAARA